MLNNSINIFYEEQKNIIQKCKDICENPNQTIWNKFYFIITNLYSIKNARKDEISCPCCAHLIQEKDIINDLDICNIEIDNNNKFIYHIVTPCCKTIIFSTDKWNSTTYQENEILDYLRNKYQDLFLEIEQKYRIIKNKYITICDMIYEREQGWKKK